MHAILIPESQREALEAMHAGRAWSALRAINQLVRNQQKHGEREDDWTCLDNVRGEYYDAVSVLGED